MDLNHIATFVQVVEKGSFTGAAATLGLPKSSVSRAVTRLEQDLGVALLRRTTRKIMLTDAGRVYVDHARRALGALDEASERAADERIEPRGTIRLTAPADAGSLLAEPIAAFVRRYPRVHVDFLLTSRKVDLVSEGVDLALRGGRLPDSSLVGRKIGPSTVALFASPGYLKRRGRPKRLADLTAHDCVLFRGARGRSVWHLEGPEGEERVEVTGPVSGDEMAFVVQLMVAGVGIALVPRPACAIALRDGRVVPVLPEYAQHGVALFLVHAASRHIPHRVTLLRDFLADALTRVLWAERADGR